eukprot:CAMPEP_0206148530 /NCGR_PEP_ID=MMETSP1473-20131121/36882_1 /ASSEMBLY_ACC=CAM_ASM_001109 /TAXON_ID=1461547 /ORGANISM="Stichococcus sp, Strain RCC1054" /LENGTH=210 /DNA_ID=CAMNT_0053545895 /DNA_START=746 /DNA_END=1376 /DNA_ORIENTATION=-
MSSTRPVSETGLCCPPATLVVVACDLTGAEGAIVASDAGADARTKVDALCPTPSFAAASVCSLVVAAAIVDVVVVGMSGDVVMGRHLRKAACLPHRRGRTGGTKWGPGESAVRSALIWSVRSSCGWTQCHFEKVVPMRCDLCQQRLPPLPNAEVLLLVPKQSWAQPGLPAALSCAAAASLEWIDGLNCSQIEDRGGMGADAASLLAATCG